MCGEPVHADGFDRGGKAVAAGPVGTAAFVDVVLNLGLQAVDLGLPVPYCVPDAEVGRVVFQGDAECPVAVLGIVLGIGPKLLAPACLGNHGVLSDGLDAVVVVLGDAQGSTGGGDVATAQGVEVPGIGMELQRGE